MREKEGVREREWEMTFSSGNGLDAQGTEALRQCLLMTPELSNKV